jgi:cytochrome c biogenesis protein CcmG/thiol:disulfide interchange protein DsbE
VTGRLRLGAQAVAVAAVVALLGLLVWKVASWCGPCKEETPLLERTWQRWRDRDVVFVGVNVKDFRGDALEFLGDYGVTYPNVYDGKGWTVGRFGVTGFPETYFLDAQGRVVFRVAGPVDEGDLEQGIAAARDAA